MGARPTTKRRRGREKFKRRAPVGSPPGTMIADPAAPRPKIRVFAYGPEGLLERDVQSGEQVREFLDGPTRQPVVWIDVVGLGDAATIAAIGDLLNLHKLALEDVINIHQRPKVDMFPGAIFFVARVAEGAGHAAEPLTMDQLSLFLGKGFVLTFQERPGDAFDPVRRRIRENIGRIRSLGPDYLAYSLIDAEVDAYFPVLESLGEQLEGVEERLLSGTASAAVREVHRIRRDLLTTRRAAWPLRDALGQLYRDPTPLITDESRLFLRDCYDHAVQIIDLVESYREIGSDLVELHLTQVNNRINEVTKILAVIATVFIPLNFVAALYGMNFDPDASPLNMPELRWKFGYPAVLILMAAIAFTTLSLFIRRGWIGRENRRSRGEPAGEEPV